MAKVRKQVYLEQGQNRDLRRIAKKTGVPEAEIIRAALDRHLRQFRIDEARQAAWKQVNSTIQSLVDQGPAPGGRAWRREDLYDRR